MSRRVKRPLAKSRTSGDRPKERRRSGSKARRPPARRPAAGRAPRQQAAARFRAAARARLWPSRRSRRSAAEQPLPTKVQTVVVTADENNMRVDRFLEARFPGLSFSHIQRIVRKGELRVNGKRADSKDRLRGRAEHSHSAAEARCAQGRRTALGSCDEDAAGAEGHDPVRGRRRHGAEQARRACGAGRLRHHAKCRSICWK